jgi:beta-lactamase class C
MQTKKIILFFLLFSTGLAIAALIFKDQLFKHKSKEIYTEHDQDTIVLPESVTEYLNFILGELDSTHTIGAALTIIYDNRILVSETYGVKKAGTKDSVDEHTVFRLASVSKGFAGVLACILEKDSILSLDEKVKEIIPDFALKDSVNTYELTIQNLLSHTTGLVPHAFDNLIEDGVGYSTVLQKLPEVDISGRPGELYSYQNVIFSLFDSIAHIRSGLPYDILLRKKILRPLKMRNASANPHIFKRRRSNIAHPHYYHDTIAVPLPPNTGYYNLKPAAGINASISDMSKWLLALLGNNPDVLDSTILEKITTPVIVSPLKWRYIRNWDPIDSKYYSLGWRIYLYKGRKIIYHGGYVTGYRAEIAFCPEENVGIAFLQNSPNHTAAVCVPEFFNRWFIQTDSIAADTVRHIPLTGHVF